MGSRRIPFLLVFGLLVGCERVTCPPNATKIKKVDSALLDHHTTGALVATKDATHTAAASGDWSAAETWEGGVVPGDGARVLVPSGVTVTVDGEQAASLKTVGVAGALRFAPEANTALYVDTLIVHRSGSLEIGTASAPVQPDVSALIMFTDDGPIDEGWDVQRLSRGAVLLGHVEMFGAEKTAFAALAEHPVAGAQSLSLSTAPTGWRVGDELVIAATDPTDPTSDEVRFITAIDGAEVSLDAPLALDHVAPRADLDVHVANLTRNIVLTSENTEDIKQRGHVMFMHNLDVDIRYAGFVGLGRTDKRTPTDDFIYPDLDEGPVCMGPRNNIRGRYSVHFHQGGSSAASTPARVEGSVVNGDPGWAFVNHSSNVDFIANVSYDVVGGAFQTEAGDEIGSFIGNIALRTVNPDMPLTSGTDQVLVDIREEFQDFAFQGDAFWIHGGGPRVEDNVAAGTSGHAYIYWPEGLIEGTDAKMKTVSSSRLENSHLLPDHDQIDIWWVPVASFSGNEAYVATKGLEFYYLHATFLQDEKTPVPRSYINTLESTFEDLTFWGMSQHAVGFNFTENVTLRNVRIVGDGAPGTRGVDADQFHNLDDYCFEDMDIEGFPVGMAVPTQGDIRVLGGRFDNDVDLLIQNPQLHRRDLLIKDVSLEGAVPIEMAPDFTLAAEVQDGLDDEEDEGKNPLFFLMPDRIILDYGPFERVGLYYAEQEAGFVPMRRANAHLGETDVETPDEYVGLTNKQLLRQHEMTFGGALLPDSAETAAGITGGLIGPIAPEMRSMPEVDL